LPQSQVVVTCHSRKFTGSLANTPSINKGERVGNCNAQIKQKTSRLTVCILEVLN
jgi:hypothetical protein